MLKIVNQNTDFWDNTSDEAFPALLKYGGEIYELDSNPGVQSDYIYIIANSDGTFKTPTISGYTKLSEYKANSGIWDTGNTYCQPSGETGLFNLSKAYSSLDFQYGADEDAPLEFGHDDLKGVLAYPQYDFIRNDYSVSLFKTSDFSTLNNQPTDIKNEYGFELQSNITSPDLSNYDNIQCLLIGQSNASTRAYTGDLSEFDSSILSKIFFMSDSDVLWVDPSTRLANVDLRIGELNYAYKLAELTGKKVYLTHVAQGGTGFSGSPSWLVSANELAKDAVDTYNAGKALITGTRIGLDVIWNQGEQDASGPTGYKQNLYDLIDYIRSQTGDNLRPIFHLFNKYSYSITDLSGSQINADKNELVNRPNDALFLGDGFILHTDDLEFFEDRTHFTNDSYITLYQRTAQLSYNQIPSSERVEIKNNPNIRLTSNLELNSEFYKQGAKSLWIKFKHKLVGSNQVLLNNYDLQNGFRFRINSNAVTNNFFYYQGGVNVLTEPSIGGGVGDVCHGFSWDGTTNANAAFLFSGLMDDFSDLFIKEFTMPDTEPNISTNNLKCQLTNNDVDVYGIFTLDRKLTEDDLSLIKQNRDTEIEGVEYYGLQEGYGTSVYDNLGNQAADGSGITWHNNSYEPKVNTYPNLELQIDGSGNYRVATRGVIESGWSKVEDIFQSKWYHILGSNIKFPEIYQLRSWDAGNYIYDSNGVAQELSITDLENFGIPPKEDSRIDNEGDCIKNWANNELTP